MARILQYIHRPNMTELGMGNTHDRYLVGPEDKLKLFFPLGVTTEVMERNILIRNIHYTPSTKTMSSVLN